MIPEFRNSFKKYAKETFIIESGKKHTYHETDTITDLLAGYLKKLSNIGKGTICALLWDQNEYAVYLTLAIWKCSGVCVPVNPDLTELEKRKLLEKVKPDVVLRSKEISKFIPGLQTKDVIRFKETVSDQKDTAIILFTSGTSGKPKGVKLSYQNLTASYQALNTVLPHTKKDKWLASLPFYHIGGFSIITRALFSGASLIIPDNLKTDGLIDAIKKNKPSFASLVSTQFRRLLEAKLAPPKELKKVLLGGGFISDDLIEEGLKKKWKLAKVYGSSETSSLVTYLDCNKDKKISSAGKPLPGNTIEIIEKKKTLPANKVGEICIQGKSVSGEYFNAKRETSMKYKNGFYHSGDYGYLDEEGYLFIEARRTDLIVSGGKNINPLEVETALKKIPGIKDAAVFPEEDKEWGHIVSAALILEDKKVTILPDAVKQQLKDTLSSYKIPKKIYFVDEFPVTPLGKIKKQDLIRLVKK